MRWITDFILRRVIKRGLDLIPANGKKTVVGVLVVIISVAIEYVGEGASIPFLQSLLELLKGIPHDALTDTTIAGALSGGTLFIIGLIHKVLKNVYKAKE